MGRELNAWRLCENTIGKYLTDRLRRGEPIQIAAGNGELYEIDPVNKKLKCITKDQIYCVHPEDTMRYPFGDMAVLWWTFLHHDPEHLEATVGPDHAGHRTSLTFTSQSYNRIHRTRANPRIRRSLPPLRNFQSTIMEAVENPAAMLERLPGSTREKVNILLADFARLCSSGDIEILKRR